MASIIVAMAAAPGAENAPRTIAGSGVVTEAAISPGIVNAVLQDSPFVKRADTWYGVLQLDQLQI